MSQTVVSGGLRGGLEPRGGTVGRSALALGSAVDLLEAEDGRPPEGRDWVLPSIEMLTIVPEPPVTSSRANHEANIRIIEDKLNSFGIPATVIATNTGTSDFRTALSNSASVTAWMSPIGGVTRHLST